MTPETLRQELLGLADNLVWVWKPRLRTFLASLGDDKLANPRAHVRRLPEKTLKEWTADSTFLDRLEEAKQELAAELQKARERCPQELAESCIAYFSAEYGIHQSLPIYSGGLGVLSGDHTKSGHDHGLPLVCVGLFYRQGYFVQRIDAQGQQQAGMDLLSTEDLPANPVLDGEGKPLCITVDLPAGELMLHVWLVMVGNTRLYLLDSDVEGNPSEWRSITWQLYGGDRDMRIRQEIVLGIGGVRALRAMGIQPEVWHMNEGHSAFLAVERVAEYLARGLAFDEAVETVSSNTVFTTHTPVSAGNEAFILPRLHNYFQPWCEKHGMDFARLLELGTLTDNHGYKNFSLTALAVRLSRFANGVSKLHGEVSRKMWYHLWHQLPIEEAPIGHVTNGVHMGTWISSPFRALFEQALGEEWEERLASGEILEELYTLPAEGVWNAHGMLKQRLYDVLAENQRRRFAGSPIDAESIVRGLRPESLTIGFARRFATYKRADLLFSDLDRLDRIVNDPERPVTFLFAGKAHPADKPGQEMIRRIHEVSLMERFRGRIVLLEGYDMEVASHLVRGVDVWMNNPRRPLEASGTSGQKVPPNGGLNFSILDGWWVEGFDPARCNGWVIGREKDYGDDRIQDYYDVKSQYDVLEGKIVPLFFRRDAKGLPQDWIECMKHSMASLSGRFSTRRMVGDYIEQYYKPARLRGRRVRSENLGLVHAFIEWRRHLMAYWYHMTDTFLHAHRGENRVEVEAGLYLGLLHPEDVRVQLHMQHNGDFRTVTVPLDGPTGEPGEYRYKLVLEDELLRDSQLRLRVLPNHDFLERPIEMGICFWFSKKL